MPQRTHEEIGRLWSWPGEFGHDDTRWALIDSLLPDPPRLSGQGGCPEKHCRRLIVDAILYTVDNGIKGCAPPVNFPPWNTVYQRSAAWELVGASQRLLDAVRNLTVNGKSNGSVECRLDNPSGFFFCRAGRLWL